MLSKLIIEHIALIDQLEMDIPPGLVVITGETGAGKSIMIDAVNLVMGERADRDLIQSGAEKAWVEAVFEVRSEKTEKSLQTRGVEVEDGQLILARELAASGRNICRLNGRLSSLSALKAASDLLVDIHGQHEHQYLLHANTHLSFLDDFGGEKIAGAKEDYRKARADWRKISQMLKNELGSESERARQRDILTFQIDEITAASLRPGEEEALEQERTLLINHERIQSALENALRALQGDEDKEGALGLLGGAEGQLKEIAGVSESFAAIQERLSGLYYELDDLTLDLSRETDGGEFDAYRYDEVEKRLEEIHGLKRKYGDSVEEILAFQVQAMTELDELEEREKLASEGEVILRQREEEAYRTASTLHKAREVAATELSRQLMEQLQDLSLEKAAFHVNFAPFPSFEGELNFPESGLDTVEFLLSTNPGEPVKPLRKVASGGELSRIMLAFKTISASSQGCDTLIFDEIDTGISGKTAAVVGEKMHSIARKHQVLCVTHSAQIAAHADHHFHIEKVEEKGRTFTRIHLLNEEEHIAELARIVGGTEATPEATAHAEGLVRSARSKDAHVEY